MEWIGEGKRDREIAAILGLSRRTVEKHAAHIFVKLRVETRTAAVRSCHHFYLEKVPASKPIEFCAKSKTKHLASPKRKGPPNDETFSYD